ncbi:MAG: hypothetical protein NWF05_05755 [Candidatus Bathyarchaeota archaeon]|nr:hypothetical protein [Candidatus Bathyarchaeota archaeon]
MNIKLPSEQAVVKAFAEASQALGVEQVDDSLKDLVIYEMTDGMRTSTQLEGDNAYFDGGIFCLRFIHMLRILGMSSCYVNVIEEKHTHRENYTHIFGGLRKLYPIYEEYAQQHNVRLIFLGDLEGSLEPKGYEGNFSQALKHLESKTEKNSGFTAYFLINYSLDWAMKNESKFASMPMLDVTVRHTKFQFPTGMMLPAAKSDFCSLIYVQQGSAGTTWSDEQIIQLITLALRSKLLNNGTQYLKCYKEGEKDAIRSKRETELFMVHRKLNAEKAAEASGGAVSTKRAILAGPAGPEIYEF